MPARPSRDRSSRSATSRRGPALGQRDPPWRPARRRASTGIATSRELTLRSACGSLPDDEALVDRRLGAAARRRSPTLEARAWRRSRGPGSSAKVRAHRCRRPTRGRPTRSSRCCAPSPRVPGLDVEPQVRHLPARRLLGASGPGRPRTCASSSSADSFEWHGDRAGLPRGRPPLHLLVADGWTGAAIHVGGRDVPARGGARGAQP